MNKFYNQFADFIQNKKILVLGFGREGQTNLSMIEKVGGYSSVTIADQNNLTIPVNESINTICGSNYLDCLDDFDLVFKSPGIVLPKEEGEYSCQITCMTDIFIKVFGSQTIGITGTKGKSTTSALIYHVLQSAGINSVFGGNIGIPIFNLIDDIDDDTVIVLELSCHQLEYAKYSPHIAILLNFYEDHLDHYGTFEKYCNAKKNIYKNQSKTDILLSGPDVVPTKNCISNVFVMDKSILPFKAWDEIESTMLRGEHNLLNAAFVYSAVKFFGVDDEVFIKALSTFKTLAHRLELVTVINGSEYFDDSISTTVETAISAMESIKNTGIILLGGMNRGINYEPLINYLRTSTVDAIVFMYESGKICFDMLNKVADSNTPKRVYVDNLKEACEYALANSLPGRAVVLSPAAASYGYFKNFEERGDMFKKYIGGINETSH